MRCIMIFFLSLVVSVLNSCSVISQIPAIPATASVDIPQGKIETLERRITAQVEQNRKAAGLKPMAYHAGMTALARKHSDYLKNKFTRSGKRVLNHDGFSRRANKIVLDYSMSKTAENVAYIWGDNGDPAERISTNWMNSPKHKENILKHWNYTGVGVAMTPDGTIYATQLFGLKTDFTFP